MKRLWPFARLLGEERGVSAIEFAFIAPMIAVLIIGIIDFGMGLWQEMEVASAAAAGSAYAAKNGWNSTASGIDSAVTSATSLASITVALNNWPNWCGCPSAGSGITQAPSCGSDCSDGSLAGHYIIVSASTPYSTILPWPGISRPMTLSYTTYARLYP